MSGLLLRLAGPLQSWGEHSAFGERDTCRFPTRSGLLGMFAAAEGRRRTEPLDDYDPLRITIRIDRPGVPLVDFHTVGGGYPAHKTVPTAEGKRRSAGAGTIVSRRHYLADAAFTVAVTAPEEAGDIVDRIGRALTAPVWPPYLGRRSCPPDAPFVLSTGVVEAERELETAVPVDGGRTAGGTVTFVTENGARPGSADATIRTELNDVPVNFSPRNRRYRTREVVLDVRPVPDQLYATGGSTYLQRLTDYLEARP